MTTVVLGAGAVGTATAWYLRKSGHDVVLVERQGQAAMETSWGNGGVIHASEVEPWSQPGMPMKIIKWLGKENAPLNVTAAQAATTPSHLYMLARWRRDYILTGQK